MSETTLVDSSMDFASLAKMRLDAARNPEKTVDKVAEQFESIFINMMLKSMRNATERSSLMDSQAGRMYESMFDQEVSLHQPKKALWAWLRRSNRKYKEIKRDSPLKAVNHTHLTQNDLAERSSRKNILTLSISEKGISHSMDAQLQLKRELVIERPTLHWR